MRDHVGEPPTIGEITDLFIAFEAEHDVHAYRPFGWSVWPTVRPRLAALWLAAAANPDYDGIGLWKADTPRGSSGAPRAIRVVRGLRERARLALTPGRRRSGALILTTSDRFAPFGEAMGHQMSAPLYLGLEQAGHSAMVVHIADDPGGPTAVPQKRLAIEDAMALTTLVERLRGADFDTAEPDWFEPLLARLPPICGGWPDWQVMLTGIRSIETASKIFDAVLQKARPEVVFVDCWTNWYAIGLTLAAHRRNIPVVDVQHGHQEHGHYSYHGWQRRCLALPDAFWVWGPRAAARHRGASVATVLEAGNPWLNLWRSRPPPGPKDASGGRPAGRRTALVTLSWPMERYLSFALETARAAPGWTWQVRLHPAERISHLAKVEQAVGEAGLDNVQVEEANARPLYELLANADLHLTFDSTCGSEALAFGVPTVVCHPVGRDYYGDYIRKGLMAYAETPPEAAAAAGRLLDAVSPAQLLGAADEIFSPPSASEDIYARLPEIVAGLRRDLIAADLS
jgi:hypothetical protein